MSRPLCVLVLAFGCALLTDCSGSSGPRVASVNGTVTYKDKPLANADVTFAPEDGGRVASGRTDANGRFTLGTFSTGDGAIIGKHRVSVRAHGPERDPKPGEGSGMPGDKVPGDALIPTKYFAAETSGLTYEVKHGSNHADLELKD
jgi:hypothetical protein